MPGELRIGSSKFRVSGLNFSGSLELPSQNIYVFDLVILKQAFLQWPHRLENLGGATKAVLISLVQLLWNCPQVNATKPCCWLVSSGFHNVLVLSGSKPSTEPLPTQIYRSMLLYGVTRPQWVNFSVRDICVSYLTVVSLQLNCDNTCQILIWHIWGKQCFFNSLAPRRCGSNITSIFSKLILWIVIFMLSGECHETLFITSQCWMG